MVEAGRLEVLLSGDLAPLARELTEGERLIERAGQRLQQIGSALTLGVTLPVLAVGAGALKASADWETAMVNVAKTVDEPAARIAELGREFVDLSERIPVAAIELASIGAAAGQLGIATDNIFAFTETIAALAVSTNLSSEEAAQALARLANITGLPQTEFDRLGSAVVDLGNNMATTEAEIVEFALRIAGAGTTVGLTEAQILAFGAALSSVGIRAEAGGTAVSRVMVEIANAVATGGERLENFAEVAELTVEEFADLFRRDAAQAVLAFIEGLGRIERAGGNVFAVLEDVEFADIRVRDALLRTANAGDLVRRALEIGNTAWVENTALTDEAAKFYDRLSGRLEQVRNKAGNVAAELGDTLRPSIDFAIDGSNELLDLARELVAAFGDLPVEVRAAAAAFALFAAGAGPAAFAVGGFLRVLPLLAGLVTPTGLLVLGLGAVSAAIVGVATAARQGTRDVDAFTDTLQRQFPDLDPDEVKAGILAAAGTAAAGVRGEKAPPPAEPPPLPPPAPEEAEAVAEALSKLATARAVIAGQEALLGDAFDADAAAAQALELAIAELLAAGVELDADLGVQLGTLRDLAAEYLGLKTGIDAAIEAERRLAEEVTRANRAATQATQEALRELADVGPDRFLRQLSLGAGVTEETLDRFGLSADDLEEKGDELHRAGVNLMESFVAGLIQGTTDFGEFLRRAIADLASTFIVGTLKEALGIASPSKVARDLGEATVEGFAMGLEAKTPRLRADRVGATGLGRFDPVALSGGGLGGGADRLTVPLTINAVDSRDVERALEENAHVVVGIIARAARGSSGLRALLSAGG